MRPVGATRLLLLITSAQKKARRRGCREASVKLSSIDGKGQLPSYAALACAAALPAGRGNAVCKVAKYCHWRGAGLPSAPVPLHYRSPGYRLQRLPPVGSGSMALYRRIGGSADKVEVHEACRPITHRYSRRPSPTKRQGSRRKVVVSCRSASRQSCCRR